MAYPTVSAALPSEAEVGVAKETSHLLGIAPEKGHTDAVSS